jgi:hypothetical protein
MKIQILAMTAGFFLLGAWVSYSHVRAAEKMPPRTQGMCDQQGGNDVGPTSRPDGNRPPPPPPGFGPGDDDGPPPPPPPRGAGHWGDDGPPPPPPGQ